MLMLTRPYVWSWLGYDRHWIFDEAHGGTFGGAPLRGEDAQTARPVLLVGQDVSRRFSLVPGVCHLRLTARWQAREATTHPNPCRRPIQPCGR